jgi:demethoxyubiquinone hydroxylase (CLK1/Coq7/Cat5 family)
MGDDTAAANLVRQLQLAYSGELAAACAYAGHWRALHDPEERASIRTIEQDEWHHRRLVGGMLQSLGAKPRLWREIRAWLIGRILGLLCHVSGWMLPMAGAGKLESRNVAEYVVAALHAAACNRHDLVDPLLCMAEVEWDHQAYFRQKIERHGARHSLLWPALPPRSEIRAEFVARGL